ncbi:MAG: energy transducer TonB [Bacteroidales bacterium]|nr:energy transducer TonB [Bacteroidales bacterium]
MNILFLCILSTGLSAQMVTPDSTFVSYVDSLHLWQEKVMAGDGRLYSVKYYSDLLLTIQELQEQYYYSNGRLKSEANYKEGKLSGEVHSYYSDGRVRRSDVFEDGYLREGNCFATNGMKIAYTDYKKEATYVGGVTALYTIISVTAQQITLPDDEKISGVVQVLLKLDRKGNIVDKYIVKGLHPLYDAEVLRIVEHFGRFEPEERDGEPVLGSYLLSIRY